VRGSWRAPLLAAALAACVAPRAAAQLGPLTGYYLNVPGHAGSSALGPGGWSDYQRLRLMLGPALGPLRLEAAYEQLFLYQQTAGAAFGALAPGAAPATGDWLGLDWTLAQRGHVLWRHRFDRLNVALPRGGYEVRVGRQAISWATTLLFTPADPFAPFDPSDPFREYRSGVDAARVQVYPGPFSSLDFVVRPERTATGRTVTAAARGKVTVGTVDLSAWGGVVDGDPAGAAGATGTVAGAAWRTEVAVREDSAGRAVLRFAAGLDRRWGLFGRDLYVVVEYQHDGFGATSASQLAAVLGSAPYRRGEMQVLGRDVAAGQLQYQVHPLVSAELLVLRDLRDGSTLLAPALAISAANDLAVRIGAFLPAGRSTVSPFGAIGSEFGIAPRFVYGSLSWFF
jgi:hypothetical protein